MSNCVIKENPHIINSFLKELINTYNIKTIIIKENSIAPLILNSIANISNLTNLYLLEEGLVNYEICDAIIKTNCLNFVSLYNIPTFLLELLDKEKIKVDSRNEILFSSNFMKDNGLENFSSLYYKTKINLNFPFSKDDEEDFKAFININKYLKTIYVNTLNKNDIENILEILNNNKIKNIRIYLNQNIHDIELIEYLKKMNKKNAKTNKIKFLISYSEEYIEDNLMNQIHLNTIKTCIFISLFLVSSLVVYVFTSNYTSMQKVESIQDDINKTMAKYKEEKEKELQENEQEQDNIDSDNKEDSNDEIDNEENSEEEEKVMNGELESLLQINEDTVGWLKVNNTNIDYPIVQTDNNDFYLDHNYKKDKDSGGWIFMDYRANPVNLSDNTIIFGHNMYYSGVMFGTLYKAKYSNWYTNPENQIIEFNTMYDNLKWQIFSIYVLPNTNDYLIANFSSRIFKFNY